jgi:hypothetical protein
VRFLQLAIIALKSGAYGMKVRTAQHRQFLSMMPGRRCSVKQSNLQSEGIRGDEALVA